MILCSADEILGKINLLHRGSFTNLNPGIVAKKRALTWCNYVYRRAELHRIKTAAVAKYNLLVILKKGTLRNRSKLQ